MADASASECVAKRKRSHSLSPGEVSESPALKKQDTSLPRATPQPVLNRSTYSPHLQISASINPPTGPAQSAPRSSSNRFYIPPFSQSVSYHARPQVPQKRMPVKHEHSSPPSIARHPSVPAFGQVTAPRSAMVYGHVPERASHITPFEGRSSLPRQHQVVGQAAQSDERKYSPFHGYRDRQDRLLSSESSGVSTPDGMVTDAATRIRNQFGQLSATQEDRPIIIFVGTGPSKKRYDIMRSNLCRVSDSFKLRLTGPGQESRDGIMFFDKEPSVCWDVFAVWVQDRSALEPPHHNPGEHPMTLGSLVGLYQMAIEHKIPDFRKAVLRCIVRRLVLESNRLPVISVKESINMIYNRVNYGDVLREIVLDWLLCCVPRDFTNCQIITKELPAECSVDFVTRLWTSSAMDGRVWTSQVLAMYAPL